MAPGGTGPGPRGPGGETSVVAPLQSAVRGRIARMLRRLAAATACSVLAVVLGDWLSKRFAGPGVAAGEGREWDAACLAGKDEAKEENKARKLLVIYGASGPTGKELMRLALEAGYSVRAFVRDPKKLGFKPGFKAPERLEVFKGDLTDLPAVRNAVAGAFAVVSVAGSKPEWMPGPMTAAVPAMVAGCRKYGVKKLIVQTGALSSVPGERWGWFTMGNLVRLTLKHQHGFTTMDDNDRVIRYLHDEVRDVRWVISRPPGIEHGDRRGPLAPNTDPFKPTAIRYIDLAEWTLAQVESDAYVGKIPRLYYPPVTSAL